MTMPPPRRGRDDYRPAWYLWMEKGFDGLLRGVGAGLWLWGLGIFALVLWGLWMLLR